MSDPMQEQAARKSSMMAGYAAITIVGILIFIKAVAYYMTGSVSILSSLTDSIVDSLVSVMALMSILYAHRPADEDHRWGHGKMEAVSALFQSAMIIGGGAFLVFESINRLTQPHEVQGHVIGMAVMVVSIILSIVLVGIQRKALRVHDSLAVEADSAHYGSDIIVNIGVLLVLFATANGAPIWLDAAFAFGVALFMAYLARGIAQKSMNMLMDREIPEAERAQIIDIIEGEKGVLGWHDLRTRKNGTTVVIAFDMEADGDQTLRDAHNISKEIENKLIKIFPLAEIFIHIDPHDDIDDSRHRVKGVHK